MKRSLWFALFLTGTLAVLTAPASAKENGDAASMNASDDSVSALQEDMNTAIGSLKAQMNGIQKTVSDIGLYGDVRVKYANSTQAGNTNPVAGNNPVTIFDKDQAQIRVRLGIKKSFGDVDTNLRLVTESSPTYPNSVTPSLGDGLSDASIYIDTASLAWAPGLLNKKVKVGGGLFQNNLDYTPITWDDTLNLQGAFVELSDKDSGLKLLTVYTDYANYNDSSNNAIIPAKFLSFAGVPEDGYVWNTQLAEDMKMGTDKLHLMVGYEYMPYITAYLNAGLAGTMLINGKTLLNDGMITDYGGVIPDIQMGEFMAAYTTNIDTNLPMKWTLHLTNNFDSFNVPNVYLTSGTSATPTLGGAAGVATGGKAIYGYSQLSNSFAGWLSVDIGDTERPAKDSFGLQLAAAYVDPNAQYAFFTDHDGGWTNSEYLRMKIGFGLENNVCIQYKTWALNHVYYDQSLASVGTSTTSLFGATQSIEWVNFFYFTATL